MGWIHKFSFSINNIKWKLINESTNEIINISNSQGTSIGDAIKFAKQKLGSSSELVSIDPPHFHSVVQVKNVVLNNKKLLSYGYNPSINTMQAIETML